MKGSVALYSMQSLNPGSRSTISHHLVFPFSGSAITGPIGKECADLWPRIASAANAIVWNQDLEKFTILCAPYLDLSDVILYQNIYGNVLASCLFLEMFYDNWTQSGKHCLIILHWACWCWLILFSCLSGLGSDSTICHFMTRALCTSFLRLFSNVSCDHSLQWKHTDWWIWICKPFVIPETVYYEGI